MKFVKVIAKAPLNRSNNSGCGECQASCQSACKTSCTIANQSCQNPRIKAEKEGKEAL